MNGGDSQYHGTFRYSDSDIHSVSTQYPGSGTHSGVFVCVVVAGEEDGRQAKKMVQDLRSPEIALSSRIAAGAPAMPPFLFAVECWSACF